MIFNPDTPTMAATQIISVGNSTFTQLATMHKRLFNLVWNNPACTPEQVLAALGTNAATVFKASAALATMLNTLVPETVNYSPTKAYTINSNGTVTINE